MNRESIGGLVMALVLIMGLGAWGSATALGTTMLTGLFTRATGAEAVATVNARFGRLQDGERVGVLGRYIAGDRFELTRFEP